MSNRISQKLWKNLELTLMNGTLLNLNSILVSKLLRHSKLELII